MTGVSSWFNSTFLTLIGQDSAASILLSSLFEPLPQRKYAADEGQEEHVQSVEEMKNSYLAPERLEIRVGETTRILVKNNDFFVHTFELDELGVKHTILPFSELLIELRPNITGKFTFRSEAPMTGDMEGTLVVTQ